MESIIAEYKIKLENEEEIMVVQKRRIIIT